LLGVDDEKITLMEVKPGFENSFIEVARKKGEGEIRSVN
jgi:hypothetical protein